MATDLTIKQMMSELNTLKLEIKNRRADLKKLTNRVKDINEKISVFLKEKNQPGIKDQSQGIAIISKKVKRVVRKKKKEEKDETLNVLRHFMPDDKAQRIFNELQESKKGETVDKDVLEIIKIR
jgi:cell division septum initiation protein DivIVA